jgi:hypothetical protein
MSTNDELKTKLPMAQKPVLGEVSFNVATYSLLDKDVKYCHWSEGCIVKETLEEAGRLYSEKVKSNKTSHMLGFYNGAKWQQERMYTEEEIHYIIESYQNNVENNPVHITYEEWFEQFKKK